jgi:hypothetical protein
MWPLEIIVAMNERKAKGEDLYPALTPGQLADMRKARTAYYRKLAGPWPEDTERRTPPHGDPLANRPRKDAVVELREAQVRGESLVTVNRADLKTVIDTIKNIGFWYLYHVKDIDQGLDEQREAGEDAAKRLQTEVNEQD